MPNPTFQDFAALYDFSQWESAIQNFFCDPTQGGGLFVAPPDNADATREIWTPAAGQTAFFTGHQGQIFQKPRPRVDLAPIDYSVFQDAKHIDFNNRWQVRGWQVPLNFHVITPADYAKHTAFLAIVRSMVAQMQPQLDGQDDAGNPTLSATSGLNPFLTHHQLSVIHDLGGPVFGGHWTGDKDYFITPLKFSAIFGVNPSAWPTAT